MASYLRRNDDLRRLRTRILVLQGENGAYPAADSVLRFVDASGIVGDSGVFIDNSGNLSVSGYADVSGNLAVGGLADISGDLAVGGSTDVSGNLVVGGSTDIYVNLNVAGSTDISGDLNVGGSADVSGDLMVSGSVDLSGNLAVGGSTDITGDLNVGGSADVSGNLVIGGSTDISGDLAVGGTADISGDLNVGGSADVSGDLMVSGSVDLSGNLAVGGSTDISGDLAVGGTADISGDLNVGGSADVSGDLAVGGTADISGDLTIGTSDLSSNLIVYGYISASGDIISNSGLSLLSTNAPLVGKCTIYSTTSNSDGPQFQSYKSRGESGPVEAGDELGRLNFFGRDPTNYDTASARILSLAEGNFSTISHPAELRFSTCPSGDTVAVDRICIKSNGFVGIGTSIPQATLDVYGDLTVRGRSLMTSSIYINRNINITGIGSIINLTSSPIQYYSLYGNLLPDVNINFVVPSPMPDYDIEIIVLNKSATDTYTLYFFYNFASPFNQLTSPISILSSSGGNTLNKSCKVNIKNTGTGDIVVCANIETSTRLVQITPSISVLDS